MGGEVQLGLGAEVGAGKGGGRVGYQRGDVGGQLQNGQSPGQEELHEVEQLLLGAIMWRHGGDGHTPGSEFTSLSLSKLTPLYLFPESSHPPSDRLLLSVLLRSSYA